MTLPQFVSNTVFSHVVSQWSNLEHN